MQTYNRRENAGVVSLVGLGLVIVASILTVWWWSHAVWGDFSIAFLDNLAPYIGYSRVATHDAGYQETPAVAPETSPTAAGDTLTLQAAPAASAPIAYCQPGQTATFVLGFAELHQRLGEVMGQPLECEHPNPANGDTLQQTTTGLAVYRPSTGGLSFTDGWRHWALTGRSMVNWEGDGRMPASGAAAPQPATPRPEQARVANTDGTGVVLRSAPSMNARTPRGLAEGQLVTVLERIGSDWARVRGDASRQEGWVPSRYLRAAN